MIIINLRNSVRDDMEYLTLEKTWETHKQEQFFRDDTLR